MDDPTRKTTPGDADVPPDEVNDEHIQRGASESEFTVVSNRHDEPKKFQYAIPPSDPLEPTVEGRITYPDESNTTRAATPAVQPSSAEPVRASVPAPYASPAPAPSTAPASAAPAYQPPPMPAYLPPRKSKPAPRQ